VLACVRRPRHLPVGIGTFASLARRRDVTDVPLHGFPLFGRLLGVQRFGFHGQTRAERKLIEGGRRFRPRVTVSRFVGRSHRLCRRAAGLQRKTYGSRSALRRSFAHVDVGRFVDDSSTLVPTGSLRLMRSRERPRDVPAVVVSVVSMTTVVSVGGNVTAPGLRTLRDGT